MLQCTMDILQELAGLYDQQLRFLTPKPSDGPVVISPRELAEYRKTSVRIVRLNDELMPPVQEGK